MITLVLDEQLVRSVTMINYFSKTGDKIIFNSTVQGVRFKNWEATFGPYNVVESVYRTGSPANIMRPCACDDVTFILAIHDIINKT